MHGASSHFCTTGISWELNFDAWRNIRHIPIKQPEFPPLNAYLDKVSIQRDATAERLGNDVVVNRSGIAQVCDTLRAVAQHLNGIFSMLRVITIFGLPFSDVTTTAKKLGTQSISNVQPTP